MIALLGGLTVLGGTISSYRDLTSQLKDQIAKGSHAYVVTSSAARVLSPTRCEAVRNLQGVRTAGAQVRVYSTAASSAPDSVIAVWEGTAGLGEFMFPDLDEAHTIGAAAGRDVAAATGAAPGAVLRLEGASDYSVVVSGVSSLATERIKGSSRALFIPTARPASASACFVEALPGYEDALEATLTTWFGPANEWTVASLLPPGRFEVDIAEAARAGAMKWISPGFGLVIVVISASLWWSRRQEFALYDLLGFRPRHQLLMLFVEWSVTAMVPAICGAGLAVACLGLAGIHVELRHIAAAIVVAHFATICIAPAVGFVFVRGIRSVDLLKGA